MSISYDELHNFLLDGKCIYFCLSFLNTYLALFEVPMGILTLTVDRQHRQGSQYIIVPINIPSSALSRSKRRGLIFVLYKCGERTPLLRTPCNTVKGSLISPCHFTLNVTPSYRSLTTDQRPPSITSQIAMICWTHVGTTMTAHIHFVGPTSTVHVGPAQVCSWDRHGTS